MITFEQVMEFTRGISSHAAFEDEECRAYYDLLMSLSRRSTILEIGLQFGRSSSIALQVAKDRELRYVGIDPFTDPPEANARWVEMAQRVGTPYTLLCMTSAWAGRNSSAVWPDLVLVDGDHTREGVLTDLHEWAQTIQGGGYMLFHDYGRESLPDIYPTVNQFFVDDPCWMEVQTAGTLGIWQKGDRF